MRVRVPESDGWPRILPDDDGIRPAGKPDECFYCSRKEGGPRRVGDYHKSDCVTITCLVRWAVHLTDLVKGTERRVGTYDRHEVHGFTQHDWEFHKNESSWCASNALDSIAWYTGRPPQVVLDIDDQDLMCCCPVLSFEFVSILDPGPFVERPDLHPKEPDDGDRNAGTDDVA